MKFKISILFWSLAFFMISCGENEQEREREIKKLMMTFTEGVPCLSISIKPDSLDKEMLVVSGTMEDGSIVEALVKKSKDGVYQGRETFSSILARDMSNNISMRITDLSMQKLDTLGNFKGKAKLKTGEEIKFFANIAKGWYPENELNTLQTITKYQIIKGLEKGQELESFSIASEMPTTYRGKYRLKSGIEQGVYVVHAGESFSWSLSDAKAPIVSAPAQEASK